MTSYNPNLNQSIPKPNRPNSSSNSNNYYRPRPRRRSRPISISISNSNSNSNNNHQPILRPSSTIQPRRIPRPSSTIQPISNSHIPISNQPKSCKIIKLDNIKKIESSDIIYNGIYYKIKVVEEHIGKKSKSIPLKVEYHFANIAYNLCVFVIKLTSYVDGLCSVITAPVNNDSIQFVFRDISTKTIYITTFYLQNKETTNNMICVQKDATPILKDHSNSEYIKKLNLRMKDTPFEIVAGNLFDVTKDLKKTCVANITSKSLNIHSFNIPSVDEIQQLFYICIKNSKTHKCESSVIFNQPRPSRDKEIEISSLTNEKCYSRLGLNKLARAVTFEVVHNEFPFIKNIESYTINIISSYLLIKYFKAEYSRTSNNFDKDIYKIIQKYIQLEENGGTPRDVLNYCKINVLNQSVRNKFEKMNLKNKKTLIEFLKIFEKDQYGRRLGLDLTSNINSVIQSGVVEQIIDEFVNRMSSQHQKNRINQIERKRLFSEKQVKQ